MLHKLEFKLSTAGIPKSPHAMRVAQRAMAAMNEGTTTLRPTKVAGHFMINPYELCTPVDWASARYDDPVSRVMVESAFDAIFWRRPLPPFTAVIDQTTVCLDRGATTLIAVLNALNLVPHLFDAVLVKVLAAKFGQRQEVKLSDHALPLTSPGLGQVDVAIAAHDAAKVMGNCLRVEVIDVSDAHYRRMGRVTGTPGHSGVHVHLFPIAADPEPRMAFYDYSAVKFC